MRTLALFLSAIAIIGCSGQDTALRASLLGAISNGQSFNPAEVEPHDWDRLCVFSPYTTNEAAAAALGFSWDIERRTGIESRDDCYIVVLVGDETVVSYAEMPRADRELIRSEQSCFQKQGGQIVWETGIGWIQRNATDG